MTDVAFDAFKDSKVVSLDFETGQGKGKYLSAELFSVATYKKGKKVAVAMAADRLKEFWEKNKMADKTLVFHNAKFDLQVLKAEGFNIDNIKFEDTLVMAHLIDETMRKGLKDLRVTALLKPKRPKWKDIDKSNTAEYLQYSKEDAEDTIDLYKLYYPQIKKEDLSVVYNLELEAIRPVIEMEFYGLKVDLPLLDKQDDMLLGFITDLEASLTRVNAGPLNCNSTKQMQALFFGKLGVTPLNSWRTKTGFSTNVQVLDYLKDKKGVIGATAQLVLDHRKYAKLRSSFTQGLKKRQVDGYIYPSFNTTGTVTGRLSGSDPNLHQIPRNEYISGDLDTHIRSAFICEEDEYIITADYSQVELRLMAELSGDKNLCQVFKENIDVHQRTADLIGSDRQTAKGLNFGIGYGMGGHSFAHKTGIPVSEALMFIDSFWTNYSELASFMDFMKENVRRVGYLRTISGRKRRFKYFDDGVARQVMNTVIQGSAADLIKMAMIKIYRNMDRSRARLCMNVHDEISTISKRDYAEECKEIMKYSMETAIPTSIPMTATIFIGKRWSENK